MEIKYLSSAEEADFRSLMDDEHSHLTSALMTFLSFLDEDGEYTSVMISFDDPDTLRMAIDDSPLRS